MTMFPNAVAEPRPSDDPLAAVPAELRALAQWLVWDSTVKADGEPDKTPLVARDPGRKASSTDPATWATFAAARAALARDGRLSAGFVFKAGGGMVGIDIDDCLDAAGELLPWAQEIFNQVGGANTYGEVSPSGRGVKLWFFGELPPGLDGTPAKGKKGKGGYGPDGRGNVEVYQAGRYFTVTGRRFRHCWVAVGHADEGLGELYAKLLEPKSRPVTAAPRKRGPSVDPRGVPPDLRLKRCLAYVATLPDSIEGQSGDWALYQPANECVRFDLARDQAWEVMRWFNDNKCFPKWEECRLLHKIREAEADPANVRGSRLAEPPSQKPSGRPAARRPTVADLSPGMSGGVGDDGDVDLERVARLCTDTGNAARFARAMRDRLRYCHALGKWFVWVGDRWAVDQSGRVVALAKKVVLAIFDEAKAEPDEDRRAALADHAVKSQKRERITAAFELAKPDLAVTADELDADPMLLNCRNGTVDLRTGELRPHRREDYLTKVCRASFDPTAPRATFDRFIARIFRSHPGLVRFAQKAFGYAATGLTREQVLFFLYGSGANGKTTLLDAVSHVLGDYAGKADRELLAANDGHPAHPTNVADLMGRRFVVCSETNEGGRFDEAKLKDLVGESRLKARFMRQDFFEFTATHKVFLYSNHRPLVRGADDGFWRRMRLVPFVEKIGPEEKDTALPDKLQAEADGVLAWVVEGCRLWLAEGLGEPAEVRDATKAYRQEMDTIGTFLDEATERRERDEISGLQVTGASILYAAYSKWVTDAGERPLSQKRLGTELARRGFVSDRCPQTDRKRWQGIALKVAGPDPPDAA
jgi:putative DNA primase/helicase